MNQKEIIELEDRYTVRTYNRYDVVIKQGDGVYATSPSGLKYIDFTSGIGVNSLGYSDEGWVSAITEQAKLLQHTSNLFYTEPCTQVAQKLTSLTGLAKVFFANSGAEANECAIKAARKYSYMKYCSSGKSNTERYRIVTLEGAFHGRTMATMSEPGDAFHKFFSPLLQGFDYAAANDIASLGAAVNENTCAILVEFIQGEGGVNDLSSEFVTELKRICDENDIILIADEVQTGVGRTGKFMSYEYYDIKPDIVTVAKGLGGGLPIGAVIFSEKTADVFEPGDHGSTFGGNPVVCAGTDYVLSKFTEGTLMDEVGAKGEYMRDRISLIPGVLGVTGKGLMIGIDVGELNSKDIAHICAVKGLLVLTAKNRIRLLPPLTVKTSEIDEGIAILREAMKETQETASL